MVIIHPFHRISEDARHCSALSYRQVADGDYRVPEVIDRHSFSTGTGRCTTAHVEYTNRYTIRRLVPALTLVAILYVELYQRPSRNQSQSSVKSRRVLIGYFFELLTATIKLK